MRKIIVISLCLIILMGNNSIEQSIRIAIQLGGLGLHYVHHLNCQNQEIGLNDFIHLHYNDDEHHNEDHEEHENLPFHHHHTLQNAQTISFYYSEIVNFQFSTIENVTLNISSYQDFYLQEWISNIWKPPKF